MLFRWVVYTFSIVPVHCIGQVGTKISPPISIRWLWEWIVIASIWKSNRIWATRTIDYAQWRDRLETLIKFNKVAHRGLIENPDICGGHVRAGRNIWSESLYENCDEHSVALQESSKPTGGNPHGAAEPASSIRYAHWLLFGETFSTLCRNDRQYRV